MAQPTRSGEMRIYFVPDETDCQSARPIGFQRKRQERCDLLQELKLYLVPVDHKVCYMKDSDSFRLIMYRNKIQVEASAQQSLYSRFSRSLIC